MSGAPSEPQAAGAARRLQPAGRVIVALGRAPLPEIALAAALVFVLFVGSWRNQLPIGYGGFYFLAAEQIRDHAFALPLEVPFYGPGGTPFAYPPLALYLMAFATGPLHVPLFSYLRFFPPACCVVLAIAIFLLARRLLGDRWRAMAAVALAMSNATIISYHATADGAVRAPAFAFAVSGLLATWIALEGGRRRRLALTGAAVLFGLTLLTHPVYAAFLTLGVACMTVSPPARAPRGWSRRLLDAGIVIAGGLLVASPWWLTVAARWGASTFVAAGATHGSFGTLTVAWSHPRLAARLVTVVAALGRGWHPAALPGLALAGLGWLAARGRWLLPLWFVVLLFGLGESDRFLALIGALAAAELLGAVAALVPVAMSGRPRHALAVALPGLVVCGFSLSAAAFAQFGARASLTPALLDAMQWVRDRTPATCRYVELCASHDVGEWMPFLTRRTPVVCPWGAEWKGSYGREGALWGSLDACARSQDLPCVDRVLRAAGAPVDVVVLPSGAHILHDGFLATGQWRDAYANGEYAVLQRAVTEGAPTGKAGEMAH